MNNTYIPADHVWSSWAQWNDEYTALLRKRNKAEAAMRINPTQKAGDKHAAIHEHIGEHIEHPNRPASFAMRNLCRA